MRTPAKEADMSDQHTPVLVVGSGPAGLVTAAQLASMGVECTLVDRRSGESTLPRATAISVRSMEIFRSFGLEEQMLAGSVPVEPFGRLADSLLNEPVKIVPLGFPTAADAALASPCEVRWIPQDHIEPVLRDHLYRSPFVDVRYHCEVIDLSPEGDGVLVTLRDPRTGEEQAVTAQYVVAADGAHSMVRERAGITMIGNDDLGTFDLIHFHAPLKRLAGEPLYGLNIITHPDARGWLIPSSPDGRWFSGIMAEPGKPLLKDRPEDAVELLRKSTGDPALEPRIELIGSFTFHAMVADRYRAGRVFVVGDAAHRMTPRGGMGLNTAMHDGYDLGWRLGWLLSGWAGEDLLDGYERERRPVAEWNVTRAAHDKGSRLDPAVGFERDLDGRVPHAWMDAGTTSTLDLLCPGLTVFVAGDPAAWEVAATSEPRPTAVFGADDVAPELGLARDQALVVRPDGKIAWRGTAPTSGEASHVLMTVTSPA
jgi:2-polyprenyl-6-methoxyphenol hydroxylase-like FAD-dependent oxidoreductase